MSYAVVELKVDPMLQRSYETEMSARIIKQFNSRDAANRFADKLNERHIRFFDPRKEIVSFIVKSV